MRYPRQAGQFYEGTPDALRAQIEGCFTHRLGPGRLPKVTERPFPNPLALVSPHAGYMFSGPVAAHGYYEAAVYGKPEAVIIIGPNHTGMGSGVSIVTNGWWRTPLGDIKVNRDLAERILSGSGIIDIDEHAHLFEHSIEVQLPFLQYIYGSDLTFIPICMMLQDLQTSREVGIALAKALTGSNVLLIASTDLTHYEPQKVAEAKDSVVIDAIVHLDEAELQHVIEAKNVTMCGYGPVSAVIVAMKELGGRKSRLLSYHTSGDVTKDYAQVVGYCSIAIS